MEPYYKTDCNRCEYLGSITRDKPLSIGTDTINVDLYTCSDERETLFIARYSDDPSDYVAYTLHLIMLIIKRDKRVVCPEILSAFVLWSAKNYDLSKKNIKEKT